MAFIYGITWLLVFQLVGEVVVRALQIPVPGPVLGMLMLFALLVIRRGVPRLLDESATGLLTHLSLLFVPAGVGMMVHLSRIADEWLPILSALLLSTVVTLALTAWSMAGTGYLLNKGRRRNG